MKEKNIKGKLKINNLKELNWMGRESVFKQMKNSNY